MINQARSFKFKLQNDFYLSCVKPFHWHIFEQISKIANLLFKKKYIGLYIDPPLSF